MKFRLFSKERMLYSCNEFSISFKHGTLFYRDSTVEQKVFIGGKYNLFALLERMTRKEPRCAVRVDSDHILISFNGKILNYCVKDNTIHEEHEFSKGMNNPLEFLSYPDPETKETVVLYGEYIWNSEKGPVSIYRRKKGKWAPVYSFPSNTITHVHNIVVDEYRQGFWILTGDEDSESGIWFADYSFESVKPILVGRQQYRACVAFPEKNGIYYATDTPLENNCIYFVKLAENLETECLSKVFELPGPCIYGCKYDNEMYFSTSVEPDSSLSKWKYRLTYKLGKGVKGRFSHIIKRDKKGCFQDVYKVKKDLFPMWLFQFGNILFPKNEGDLFYAVLQGSEKGHGVTLQMETQE